MFDGFDGLTFFFAGCILTIVVAVYIYALLILIGGA